MEPLRETVRRAIREDVGRGDVTSRWLVPRSARGCGTIVAREDCVVCGLAVAKRVFRELDPRARFRGRVRDGRRVRRGTPVLRVQGRARAILAGERVALNFLQRLSGIATLTARFVRRVRGTGVRIFDTRKTTPGLRELEKYAVRMGGGRNHRRGLFESVLIKDNHLSFVRDPAAFARRLRRSGRSVEIEVPSMKELERVLSLPVDVVMLDNFDLRSMRRAVKMIRRRRPDLRIEASGGVRLGNLRRVAATGVDRVSVGMLTHSAPAVDFSMDLQR